MTDYRRNPDPKAQLAELTAAAGRRRVVAAAGGGRIAVVLSLPPSEASQNHQRGDWRGHTAAKRALRAEACRTMLSARLQLPDDELKPWWGANIEVRFYCPHDRRDPTNILDACKAFFDGFVDAGLLKDDRRLLASITHDNVIDKANPRTEMQIFERTKDDGTGGEGEAAGRAAG